MSMVGYFFQVIFLKLNYRSISRICARDAVLNSKSHRTQINKQCPSIGTAMYKSHWHAISVDTRQEKNMNMVTSAHKSVSYQLLRYPDQEMQDRMPLLYRTYPG